MTEASLRSRLMLAMKVHAPQIVALRHEDVRTCGIPDLSTTLNGTAWWEFKLADPDFKADGRQELTLLRLAHNGYARYVVWQTDLNRRPATTYVVHPRCIGDYVKLADRSFSGFDMVALVRYMKGLHDIWQGR